MRPVRRSKSDTCAPRNVVGLIGDVIRKIIFRCIVSQRGKVAQGQVSQVANRVGVVLGERGKSWSIRLALCEGDDAPCLDRM